MKKKLKSDYFDSKYAQILEIYNETCESKVKREKGYRNMGMCSFLLLDLIPELE